LINYHRIPARQKGEVANIKDDFSKVIGREVDKQSKIRMLQQPLTTVSLPQTYCRSCHLSTRSDVPRCLHCNKSLREPVAPPKKKVHKVRRPAVRKAKKRRDLRRKAA